MWDHIWGLGAVLSAVESFPAVGCSKEKDLPLFNDYAVANSKNHRLLLVCGRNEQPSLSAYQKHGIPLHAIGI